MSYQIQLDDQIVPDAASFLQVNGLRVGVVPASSLPSPSISVLTYLRIAITHQRCPSLIAVSLSPSEARTASDLSFGVLGAVPVSPSRLGALSRSC